jgi:hypothetical protein
MVIWLTMNPATIRLKTGKPQIYHLVRVINPPAHRGCGYDWDQGAIRKRQYEAYNFLRLSVDGNAGV